MKWMLDVWTVDCLAKRPFWKRVWWDGTEEQVYRAGCNWLKQGRKIRVVVGWPKRKRSSVRMLCSRG